MKKIILFILMIFSACNFCFAMDIAGKVTSLEGFAFIERGGSELKASIGDTLFISDSLKTDENSTLGLTLEDDTIISMGPDSHIVIENFVFQPRNKVFSLITRMLKGSFVYFSGLIGSLAPESVKIETPEANIALRGTRILVHVEN
jgi:hypothetical protein